MPLQASQSGNVFQPKNYNRWRPPSHSFWRSYKHTRTQTNGVSHEFRSLCRLLSNFRPEMPFKNFSQLSVRLTWRTAFRKAKICFLQHAIRVDRSTGNQCRHVAIWYSVVSRFVNAIHLEQLLLRILLISGPIMLECTCASSGIKELPYSNLYASNRSKIQLNSIPWKKVGRLIRLTGSLGK